jgi:Na+-driven multidrug efflux pump
VSSWVVLIPAVAVLLPAWEAKGVATATTIASVTSFLVLVLLVRFTGDPTPRQAAALPGHQT